MVTLAFRWLWRLLFGKPCESVYGVTACRLGAGHLGAHGGQDWSSGGAFIRWRR